MKQSKPVAHFERKIKKEMRSSPLCAHGPTLLFERFDNATKTLREFYACAAFRDRKACSFFQWKDSWEMGQTNDITYEESVKTTTHREARKRYQEFKLLPRTKRHVCCTCGQLVIADEVKSHNDKKHEIKSGVSLKALKRPSFLFAPLDDNKTYAQYLFSKDCVEFLITNLKQLSFTHILCVGAPRIHEEVQTQFQGNMKSMLLDLDDRYAQMYPPSKYCKYNMFNHHFFEERGKAKTSEFLAEGGHSTVLVTDPPFGGMVEALAASFTKLSSMWTPDPLQEGRDEEHDNSGLQIPIIWFFPYFLEKRILSVCPNMAMLDYKVDYDNHSIYKPNKKQKGSPVRIFTNIPQSQFKLPETEGYWFCKICQRYSSRENHHCSECKACTSKDGTTYKHCDVCERCVKPSREHCFKCQQCQIQGHVCGEVKGSGCHICGAADHKRRDCPQRGRGGVSPGQLAISVGKRKLTGHPDHPQKKKKKKR